MKCEVGMFHLAEEPTTHFDRSSSYDFWGCQLLVGTPHLSISMWTWATKA